MTTTPDTPDNAGDDQRLVARHLYWMGWRVARIAEHLHIKPATIHSWKNRDKWDDASPFDRMAGALEARYVALLCKERKANGDYKEIDQLGRAAERLARIDQFNGTGKESDLNPRIRKRNEAPRKAKNDIGQEGLIQLIDAFEAPLFDYQRTWYRANQHEHIRNILKSRRIGATWYFAREAITDAYETGKSKVFLSASKAQALSFKHFIVQMVREATGVELKGGDTLTLPNGAILRFLGTNKNTAQGYEGDLYFDEYFWVPNFQEIRRVASGNSTHKQFIQTYISTPSSIDHEAYPFWTGDMYNQRRKPKDRHTFDVSHSTLADGLRGPDLQWRHIVTLDDAEAGGCDLFDKERLKIQYSDEEYANLFGCQFMDDAQSAFPLSFMRSCGVDSYDGWPDFKPYLPRPFGNKRVWIGYDPAGESDDGDGAGLVVIAPANSADEPHRILEYHQLRGSDYTAQADFIERMTKRYDVEHIGIDVTGVGDSVAHIVERFFPRLQRYRYTPDLKSAMVRQAQHIIKRGRLQYDSGAHSITQSFAAIKRTLTKSGTQITYKAGRNQHTGHSDLAWATMHALHFEPLDGPQAARGVIMRFSQ